MAIAYPGHTDRGFSIYVTKYFIQKEVEKNGSQHRVGNGNRYRVEKVF